MICKNGFLFDSPCMKRMFDLLFATVLWLILLPLSLIISLLISATMPGPVFFRQVRIGYKGQPFTIIKFRTMKINQSDISITLKSDDRITALGRWLRRTKLDELPQLLNVIKGHMSFVGPRPDVPGYSDKLTGDDQLIWSVRPGITGIDSVNYFCEEDILSSVHDPLEYYNEVLWPAKVRLNVWYVNQQNFCLDMKIMINTLFLLIFNKQCFSIKTT